MVVMVMVMVVVMVMVFYSGKSRADLWQFAANVALEVYNMCIKNNEISHDDLNIGAD